MRRTLLALGLLAAPLLARPAAADVVFVLNSTDPSIQVVDAATREEVRRIPVLREPHHLVLSPARDVLLVGDSVGNEILFLDPATGEVRKRERISNPYNLDFTPDGKRLVVTGLRRDQVDVYDWDGANLTLAFRVKPGDMPSHIAFTPDSRMAFITLQGSRAVAALDLTTRAVVWTAEVGREPAGIMWNGDRLLVGIMGSDHVAVLNPETRRVERTIPVGRGAHALFRSPGGGPIYVTSRVDSRITALDPETLAITRVYDTPGGPDCIAFDAQGRIWTTLRWVRKLGLLDPATGEMQVSDVGRSPHGVFFQQRTLQAAGTPAAPAATR